jgi:hypothetical protein
MWQTNYLPSYMDGCKLPTLQGQLAIFFYEWKFAKKKMKNENLEVFWNNFGGFQLPKMIE